MYHDEHLSHRVAIVVEVDDFEASPQSLWTWAYERSYELAGDLRRRGAQASDVSVRIDKYLSPSGSLEGAPAWRNSKLPLDKHRSIVPRPLGLLPALRARNA